MRSFIVLILVAVTVWPAYAQQTNEPGCRDVAYEVDRVLRARGHNEVNVSRTFDGHVLVRYDDRTSRQPLRELMHVERIVADALPNCPDVTIRAYRYGVAVAGTASPNGNWRSVKGLRVDLEVETLFGYQADFFETPYRAHVALAPRLRVWWPSGLAFTTQVALPLYNKVGRWGSAYYSEPWINRASIGVRKAVRSNVLASVSGGLFDRNRYGADVQAYWTSTEQPIAIGIRLSLTGYYSLEGGTWGSTSLNMPTGYVDGTVWLPWYNLRMRGRAGLFLEQYTTKWRPGELLYATPGFKGELTRVFGETEVTLAGTAARRMVYPGIRIGIPLSPKRGISRGRVAAYLSPRFEGPWDYGRVVRGKSTGFINPERGETFESGLDVWPMLRYASPWMQEALK